MARIAIILGRLAVGGATSHAVDEALFLKNSHEVLLITGNPEQFEMDATYLLDGAEGFQHQMIPGFFRTRKIWKHWNTYRALRKILSEYKPDVVHTHTPVAGFVGRLAAASLRVKCILHSYHGLLFEGYFPAWQTRLLISGERWLARKTKFLLALSPGQKNDLVNKYRIAPASKVRCVPVGVDVASFESREGETEGESFRSRYGLMHADIVVGMIGRLVAIKNHQLGILAFQKLLTSFPNAKLVIVGDGPLKLSLQNFCHQLGLMYDTVHDQNRGRTSVIFSSWQKSMPEVMAAMNIVILTSEAEGTPLCVMEAMAAGRPVVSTKVGGVPEMIDHLQDGMLVKRGDCDGLVDALSDLLTNKQLLNKLGTKARAKAIARFDKRTGLLLVEDLIKDCQNSEQH